MMLGTTNIKNDVILINFLEQTPSTFYKKLTVPQLARKFLVFFFITDFTNAVSRLGSCRRLLSQGM